MSALENAYEFTPEEIALNREGRLSVRQRKKLDEYRKVRSCGGRAAAVGILGTLGLFTVVLFLVDPLPPGAVVAYLVVLGITAFLFLGAVLYGVLTSDLRSGKISVVAGKAAKKSREISSDDGASLGKAREVRIGKVKFRVETRKRYEAFQEGAAYRVYYVRNSAAHFILSVEPL